MEKKKRKNRKEKNVEFTAVDSALEIDNTLNNETTGSEENPEEMVEPKNTNVLFVKENFIYGKTDNIPTETIELHFHEMYEIYMLLSEEIEYIIEGEIYRLNPGDIIITNSKEFHKPVYNSTVPCLRQYVHFRPAYLFNINEYHVDLSTCFEKRNLGEFNCIRSEIVRENGIDKLFNDIGEGIEHPNVYSKVLIKTSLMSMLCKINTIFANNSVNEFKREVKNEKVREIFEYINNNLRNEISLVILENQLFSNKYYLSHIFKTETGYSIMEYISYKRIMLAKSLLLDGILPVDVGKFCGFNDHSSFYKTFKRFVGISPTDFILNRQELIYKGEERK